MNPSTSFTTLASLSQLPEASIAVCAHDAGAASHIAAWMSPISSKLRLCISGPAKVLFSKRLDKNCRQFLELDEALNGAKVLISGTGWESDLEHNARVMASNRGIPTIAVLDHWVNYRERFWRKGQEHLPDVIWVSDTEARLLAQKCFEKTPIVELPNYWLKELVDDVKKFRLVHNIEPRRPGLRLLYLLEPIRTNSTKDVRGQNETSEIKILRYWLKQLDMLIKLGWISEQYKSLELILRLHPSEPKDKYDKFIAEASKSWFIELDRDPLSESLAKADIVFGYETQALVAALACDLPSFSTIPPWRRPCRLPHNSLRHLSQIQRK